ncbi:BrnA antitoxin family protein [Candidatus Roizmanbacteria bacterium]|nr:BrnA antitoxin family protein [Candidatus Roizmanbacteria bacterium]
MKKKLKAIPKFKSEDEERDFWATHDTTEYFDLDKAIVNPIFPNLKPSTRTITIRIPDSLFYDLKMLANKKDVPYQSLLKINLAEKVKEEFSRS